MKRILSYWQSLYLPALYTGPFHRILFICPFFGRQLSNEYGECNQNTLKMTSINFRFNFCVQIWIPSKNYDRKMGFFFYILIRTHSNLRFKQIWPLTPRIFMKVIIEHSDCICHIHWKSCIHKHSYEMGTRVSQSPIYMTNTKKWNWKIWKTRASTVCRINRARILLLNIYFGHEICSINVAHPITVFGRCYFWELVWQLSSKIYNIQNIWHFKKVQII